MSANVSTSESCNEVLKQVIETQQQVKDVNKDQQAIVELVACAQQSGSSYIPGYN